MNTLPLPSAIQTEKRSNLPFLLRLSLMFAGGVLAGSGHALLGGIALVGAFLSLALWAYKMAQQNRALMNGLSQGELISMLGRESETWRTTDSVIRVLDRRFPNWRSK